MPKKDIFINDGVRDPKLPVAPFDLSYVNNITGRFGRVNVIMCKYAPPKASFDIEPSFAFDMEALVFPIQTNVRCHVKYYKIPLRVLQKNFEDFACDLGVNGLPVNSGDQKIPVPYISRPTGWNGVGSLAEQIGCCNRRLIEKQSTLRLPFKFSFLADVQGTEIYDDGVNHFDTTIYSPLRRPICNLPVGQTLNPNSSNELFTLNYFSLNNNSFPSQSTSELNIYACLRGANNNFKVMATHTFSYNSNTSSLDSYSISNANAATIDGQPAYYRSVVARIDPNSNFLRIVATLVSSGREVFIAFGATSNLATLLFPDRNSVGFSSLIVNNQKYPTKLTADTGDIVTSDNSSVLYSKLGIFNYVQLNVLSVGDEVCTFFDSVDGQTPKIPINAYPFRAYEFIHNYFPEFRNSRIDPFRKGGKPVYNQFITNDGDGADSTTPVEHFNALYEVDYFTSCVKEPQFGNAPLVGVTVNDMSDTGILTFDEEGSTNNYTVEIPLDTATGQALPITMYKDIADRPNVHRLQELIQMGISINDLRNVSTFQRYLERIQRSFSGGSPYKNLMYEFFGTNPPIGDHYPTYLGGITRNVMVDKITQQMDTEVAGEVKKAGEFAGSGFFRYPAANEKSEKISVYCSEPCLIMGLQYFSVTPSYSQYLPKHLTYRDPLDFYLDPEFAYIGPQPVFKYELAACQLDDEHLNDVFGYNRPYAEMFSSLDEVHGLFKTDKANFLLQRFFGTAPELNKSFIEINPADLLNIFSVVQDEDKIYGQVYQKIHAELPAPRSYTPRSI